MTAPLGTGYPDFGRLASEAQVLEINDIAVPVAHNFSYPAKYVGNANALQLWANPPTHGMRLQFQFYGDQGHTVIMDSYVVNLQAGDVVKQPVPILGPWLFVVVQHSDALTNTVTIQLWRTPKLARFAGLEGDVVMFSAIGAGIAGSTLLKLDHQYVMEGPAVWSGSVTGGTWNIALIALDYLGNASVLDFVDNTASPLLPRTVYLPPWHIQMQVHNLNAGAQSYELMMTRRHNI